LNYSLQFFTLSVRPETRNFAFPEANSDAKISDSISSFQVFPANPIGLKQLSYFAPILKEAINT